MSLKMIDTPFDSPVFSTQAEDTSYLDALWLDDQGRIKLLPAAEFLAVPLLHRVWWSHRHAVYGFPTLELVEWLRETIGGRRAIEVGAGNGDLGFHLGIEMTDSYFQQSPAGLAYYASARQPPTRPRPDVRKMEAEVACRVLKPDVVVASWMTRKMLSGEDLRPGAQGSAAGVVEENLIKRVQTYIHIGNRDSHYKKTALRLPHEELQFPWLVSRAIHPENNVIYLWNNPNPINR